MTDCVFCEAPATWIHRLDRQRTAFVLDGEGHVFAGDVGTCAACEALWTAGDDEAVVARQRARTDEWRPSEAHARTYVDVLRRADLGAVRRDDLLPPGAVAVRDAGFTPLEDVTGHEGVWRLWPISHRRSVPETRSEWLTENDVGQTDGRYWLVRSPWPGLTVVDILNVLWRETERGLAPEEYDAYDARLADVAHRLFGLDGEGVRALLHA